MEGAGEGPGPAGPEFRKLSGRAVSQQRKENCSSLHTVSMSGSVEFSRCVMSSSADFSGL